MSRLSFRAFREWRAIFVWAAVADSGAPRIFAGVELQRIAKNQGVELQDLPDVCFALRVFVPQADEIRAAMRQTLRDVPGIDAAKIEISSSSQHPVPFGELIFPQERIATALWNSTGSDVARIRAP